MTTPAADSAPSLQPPVDGHDLTDETPEGAAEDSSGTELTQVTVDEQAADDIPRAGWPPMSPPSRTESNQVPTGEVTGNAQLASASAPVAEARGAGPHVDMHAGVNFGTMIGQFIQAAVRIHRGQPLTRNWVDERLAAYVPPHNEGTAAEKLYDRHVLVLVAETIGSGRWTTALKLLQQTPEGELTIRCVRRETGDEFTMEGLRDRERTGWILDLRAADESVPAGTMFGHELTQTQILKDTKSYLVVVVGAELWKQIGEGAGALAEILEPPDPTDVLESYLRQSRICSNPAEWTQDHRIKPYLERLPPGQVYEWAQTIEQVEIDYKAKAMPGELPAEVFGKKVDAVIKSRSGWFTGLTGWHSKPGRTSFERNYLLAMAVFDGVFEDRPVEDVHEKVASLAATLGEATAPARGQEGPGLVELTREAGAVLQPNGIVRFPGPGYAEAIMEYFWLDRPHLLDSFTKWTAEQCLQLEQPYQVTLANKVIPWVLHHSQSTRSTPFLRSVAARWSEDSRLVDHAVELLIAACLDSQIGNLIRNATTSWIGQARTTPALKRALARVFQGLAPAYPTSMLRRLAELAESPEPGVSEAVGAVMKALWDDAELRPRLHEALTTWSESSKPTVRRAAINAFLHLALNIDETGVPVLMARTDVTPTWVIDSWRRVLEEDEPAPLALEVGRVWLDAAATSSEAWEVTTNMFVRAVHETLADNRRGTRSLNITRIAEDWRILGQALDEATRNRLRANLVDRVRVADPPTSVRESAGGA